MPFGNPILAGEELIRSAIRSENYAASGEEPGTGWRIAADGSAEFASLLTRGDAQGTTAYYEDISASNGFTYKGDELSDILGAYGRGVIAFGQYNAGLADPTTTGELAFLQLNADLVAGRQYTIHTTLMQVTNSTNAGIVLRSSGTADPTLSSPIVRYATNSAADRFVSISEILYPGETGFHKFLLSVITFTGNVTLLKGDAASAELSMWITDGGVAVTNTGISNPLAAPPDTVVFNSFEVNAFSSTSFYGDGEQRNSNAEMYQGSADNITTNQRSFVDFPQATIDAMNGASTVDYFDCWLWFDHWYFGSGGDAHIGYFNKTGGQFPNLIHRHFGRGDGQWISLKGTAAETAIRNGTFKGIMLGPADPDDNNHYGYARGATQTNTPKLRAGYYK